MRTAQDLRVTTPEQHRAAEAEAMRRAAILEGFVATLKAHAAAKAAPVAEVVDWKTMWVSAKQSSAVAR